MMDDDCKNCPMYYWCDGNCVYMTRPEDDGKNRKLTEFGNIGNI